MHVEDHTLVLEVAPHQAIGDEWKVALRSRGFLIDRARDAPEALQLLARFRHAVTFLHCAPSVTTEAAELGPTLRRLKPSLGIVLLRGSWAAAERRRLIAEYADECVGLNLEADDLVALLTALSRRTKGFTQAACRLTRGSLRLDVMGGVVVIDGKEIPLQPLQLRILACLIEHSGTVVSHDQLQRLVFRAAHIGRNSISRQICVLRRELGPYGAEITTVEGGGYGLGLA